MKPKVYSYLRFSDPKQAAGGSADRQREYAARWARERGMVLDQSLTLFDQGLSAYHQKHISRGALGVFLRAVDDGLVPRGSILIVESLDRLSRAEPVEAQSQLSGIITAGITVITASDGREYNREKLKAQPMDLVYSLLVMIRAHEESETKSKRVKAAIRRQCEGWIAGTYRGLIRNGHDPDWVELQGTRYTLIPERVKALQTAIALYRAGHGHVIIMRRLGELGLSITASGDMPSSHLFKIVRNRCLIGEKTLEVDGESYGLAGYYPAVMTPEEFAELQHVVLPRAKKKTIGPLPFPGVVTGLGIAYCGYCGNGVRALNNIDRAKGKKRNRFSPGHLRVICEGNRRAVACPVPGTCSVVPIERAVIDFCSDQLNLDRLGEGGGAGVGAATQLALARDEAAGLQLRVDRLIEALADAGKSPALTRKLREAEDELERRLAGIESLEAESYRAAAPITFHTSGEWKKVASGVRNMDPQARERAQALVGDTFSRITIFHRGLNPPAETVNESGNRLRSRKGTITVRLTSKSGAARMLEIDRNSGEWRAMEDAVAAPPPMPSGDVPHFEVAIASPNPAGKARVEPGSDSLDHLRRGGRRPRQALEAAS